MNAKEKDNELRRISELLTERLRLCDRSKPAGQRMHAKLRKKARTIHLARALVRGTPYGRAEVNAHSIPDVTSIACAAWEFLEASSDGVARLAWGETYEAAVFRWMGASSRDECAKRIREVMRERELRVLKKTFAYADGRYGIVVRLGEGEDRKKRHVFDAKNVEALYKQVLAQRDEIAKLERENVQLRCDLAARDSSKSDVEQASALAARLS